MKTKEGKISNLVKNWQDIAMDYTPGETFEAIEFYYSRYLYFMSPKDRKAAIDKFFKKLKKLI